MRGRWGSRRVTGASAHINKPGCARSHWKLVRPRRETLAPSGLLAVLRYARIGMFQDSVCAPCELQRDHLRITWSPQNEGVSRSCCARNFACSRQTFSVCLARPRVASLLVDERDPQLLEISQHCGQVRVLGGLWLICFWSRTALCASLLQRMQSMPQQSPSISLCPFPMLAAPNGGTLPRIAGSSQRHCP